FQTGRDMDEYDETCHHLIVFDTQSDEAIGNYRMQTGEMPAAKRLYSAREYYLSTFPAAVLRDSVELGRASIAKANRNTQALFLLWKGLAAYLSHNRKRYLFGCCSLTSQDEREGLRVLKLLEQNGHLSESLRASAREGFECAAEDSMTDSDGKEATIPKLFRTY